MTNQLPLLPTAVVGSYAMPGWLERLKTDYFLRRISRHDLDEIHDTAVKAAIKDQEAAGIDIVTDGELRRDNLIDYFALRLPGVEIDHGSKKFYYDFYDSVIRGKMPMATLGLVEDFRFLRRYTDRATKFTVTGPHSLVKRIRNEHYKDEAEFALDLARALNLELRELVKAGATYLQVDEPYYSGFPEDLTWSIRYGKPSWEGSYRYLFPAILEAKLDQLTLEFARRGVEDLGLFREFEPPFELGLGVIDVKSHTVETPAMVGERIRRALDVVPAERLYINPDCGLLHLPGEVAFEKLAAMVEGTKIVRGEL